MDDDNYQWEGNRPMIHKAIFVQNQPAEGHRSYMALDMLPGADARAQYSQVLVSHYKNHCCWILVTGEPIQQGNADYLARTLVEMSANWRMIDLTQYSAAPVKRRTKQGKR